MSIKHPPFIDDWPFKNLHLFRGNFIAMFDYWRVPTTWIHRVTNYVFYVWWLLLVTRLEESWSIKFGAIYVCMYIYIYYVLYIYIQYICVCCVYIYIYLYLYLYSIIYIYIFACRGVCVCVCAYELILTSACATALLIKVGPTRAEGNFMTLRSVLSLQCYSHHFSSISFLVKHGQQPLLQHRPWELRSSRWKYSADPQTHKVTWWSFVFVFICFKSPFWQHFLDGL